MNKEIHIHNHGHVRLDDAMADDLSVINSARVSFANRVEVISEKDAGLINFLMRERHGTPFEHNSFRFNIRCPIFVAREWFRHRISSFNEESLRYSRARLDFYIPEISDVRTQVGKPGAYTFEPVDIELAWEFINDLYEHYERSAYLYTKYIDLGIAKELARLPLPVGIYTEFYWTVNARSLMNFLSLRNDEHAQKEIRDYAIAVESLFSEVMPLTHQSFVKCARIAP